MDLTLAFNAWLKDRGAKPVEDRSYDIGKIDLFLQEAYSIVRVPGSLQALPKLMKYTARPHRRPNDIPALYPRELPLHRAAATTKAAQPCLYRGPFATPNGPGARQH